MSSAFFFYILSTLILIIRCQNEDISEHGAIIFLKYVNDRGSEICKSFSKTAWNFNTNITANNKQLMLKQRILLETFNKEVGKNASRFPWKKFQNPYVKRQFMFITDVGTAALDDHKIKRVTEIEADMEENYSTSNICEYKLDPSTPKRCDLKLEPDLVRIMKASKNYDELLHVWKEWRNVAGRPVRQKYIKFVKLLNEAARLNNYSDAGDSWRSGYESKTFLSDVEGLWNTIKPLYKEIHAYVRRKLINIYGKDKISENGPIPAHLLGNMWAQSWSNLVDVTMPYPDKPKVDITDMLIQKRYSALDIFKTSEDFFTSLGLEPMPKSFWEKSMIERPDDREVVCHASAWDLCDGKDVRVKQCTDINMQDFITAHHEMGHIQYYLLYAKQPHLFRTGANPGFHEAVGDLMSLSVVTPKHLQSIGLLSKVEEDYEGTINFLFSLAMDKFVFLPFAYLMDQWRWKVYNGEISSDKMNGEWWKLREFYQGIKAPVKRTEDDFDPAAKYHISANVPYVRYFIAHVLQFQFHEVLCDIAGHTGPLNECDIYKSKEAGKQLRKVLSLGSSVPWPEQLKIMTGGKTNKMDTTSILKYFRPLHEWLRKQNKGEKVGWTLTDESSPGVDTSVSGSPYANLFHWLNIFVLTVVTITFM